MCHREDQMRGYPKTELASRIEREENFINICGFETLLGHRGLYNLLHCERMIEGIGTAWFRLGILGGGGWRGGGETQKSKCESKKCIFTDILYSIFLWNLRVIRQWVEGFSLRFQGYITTQVAETLWFI